MTDPKLPPCPAIPPGPLYQAIIIDGDCTEEFVEYVQAYARAAVEAGGGRDAARYRMLRAGNPDFPAYAMRFDPEGDDICAGDELDALLDAAMTGGEHG